MPRTDEAYDASGDGIPIPGRTADWDLSIAADYAAVSEALADLGTQIAHVRPDASSDLSWQLVLAEACNNIVEHAYQEAPGHVIRLTLWLEPQGLVATLRDTGRALPDLAIPQKPQPEVAVPLDDLPEGGFGWHLIRTLATTLAYRRNEQGNLLFVVVPV